jgi:hypothetical protein
MTQLSGFGLRLNPWGGRRGGSSLVESRRNWGAIGTLATAILCMVLTSVGRIFGFFRYLPWISKMTSNGYH